MMKSYFGHYVRDRRPCIGVGGEIHEQKNRKVEGRSGKMD